MDNQFMVCVRCMTYNQSQYIEETLNGFTMQQTSFPFVCVVMDDASTDGEQEVISNYLQKNFEFDNNLVVRKEETDDYLLTFARHKTNHNCYFAVFYLKYNHYRRPDKKLSKYQYMSEWHDNAKYIAICEGDDYWSYAQKLQMQFNFLESHEDFGMVHTDFDIINGYRNHLNIRKNDDGNWFPRILTEGLVVGTLTVMYRKSIYDRIPKLFLSKDWPMGDRPLWYELAHEAKIKHFPISTAHYRVLESSASHNNDINKMIAFNNAAVEIRLFYANYYDVKLNTDGYDASYYETVIRFACRLKEKDVAKDYYHQAKSRSLLNFRARLYYFATMVPFIKPLIELIVKVKNHRYLAAITKNV